MNILMLYPRRDENSVVCRRVKTLEGVGHSVCLVKGDFRLKSRFFMLPLLFFKALRHILWCDVVHVHDVHTVLFGFVLARFFRKRIVYDVHDVYWYNRMGSFVGLLIFRFELFFVRRVDAVITPSVVISGFFNGSNGNTVCILNVPDYDFVSVVKPPSDGVLRIGYFGTVRWVDELRLLFDVVDSLPGVEVVVGGFNSGVLSEYVNDKVCVLGECSLDDVPGRYSCVDVVYCVHPSFDAVQSVSIPMKVFEAMGFGLPVIVNGSGMTGGFVGGNSVGLCVDHGDSGSLSSAVVSLRDDGLRMSLGGNGRRLFESFYNWDVECVKLVDLYDGLGDML